MTTNERILRNQLLMFKILGYLLVHNKLNAVFDKRAYLLTQITELTTKSLTVLREYQNKEWHDE